MRRGQRVVISAAFGGLLAAGPGHGIPRKQLKGPWMTRLKGSGYGGKYSFEATPLVKDGIMYIVTGNDDVFALDAKTGEFLWERWSGIDQKITSVCCGWDYHRVGDG